MVVQWLRIHLPMQGTWVGSLVWEDSRFPWWISSKESTWNAGSSENMGSIPGSQRSPGGGHSNPIQYSCLENPMDRGVWQAVVCSIAKLDATNSSQIKNPPAKQEMQETWVQSLCREDPLEKEMENPSNTLAWKISWTEEPGGPQSNGSQRIRHNWVTKHNWIDLAHMHGWKIPNAVEQN